MSGAKFMLSAAASAAIGCAFLALAGALDHFSAAVRPVLKSPTSEVGSASVQRPALDDGLLHKVQGFRGLSVIVDEATGVRVGIPSGIVGVPTPTMYGRNWKAYDNRLNIDTLRILDQSLEDLLFKLQNIRGRTSRRKPVPGGAILEGTADGGRTVFYVELRSQGDEIRGLSIVHISRASGELYALIETIKRSFVAFPHNAAAEERKRREEEVKRREEEAERREEELKRREEEAKRREEEAKRREEELKRREEEAKRREEKAKRRKEEEARRQEEDKVRRERLADWEQRSFVGTGSCAPGWFIPRQWPIKWFSSSTFDAARAAQPLRPTYRVRACQHDSAQLELEGPESTAYVKQDSGYIGNFSEHVEFLRAIQTAERVPLQFWLSSTTLQKYLAAPGKRDFGADFEELVKSDTAFGVLPILVRRKIEGHRVDRPREILLTVVRLPSPSALRQIARDEEARRPLVAVIFSPPRIGSSVSAPTAEALLWAMESMGANWQEQHVFTAISVDVATAHHAGYSITPSSYRAFRPLLEAMANSTSSTASLAERHKSAAGSDRLGNPLLIVFVVVPKLAPAQYATYAANAHRVISLIQPTRNRTGVKIVVLRDSAIAQSDASLLSEALAKTGDTVSQVLVEENAGLSPRVELLTALNNAGQRDDRRWQGLIEVHKRIGALPIVPKRLTLGQLADAIAARGSIGETSPEWINLPVFVVLDPLLMRIVRSES